MSTESGHTSLTRMEPYSAPTFTGKEKDEETGYGYLPHRARQAHHGARYYDCDLSGLFLSVEDALKKQEEGASRREKERINRKFQNIQNDAHKKQRGEEHSRGIK